MSWAHELVPIPARDGPPIVFPDQQITDELRAGLVIEEVFVPGAAGSPEVRVLLYRRRDAVGARPLILSIHGGAFCFLGPESTAGDDATLAHTHDCVVVSVDYRLAPEHPYPAAVEDCFAALVWACDDPRTDGARVVVMGASAGGAMAAAVAMMARDRRGPQVHLQVLLIPMLDDRLQTPSIAQFVDWSAVDPPAFTGRQAEGAWLHYLGEDADRASTSPYAAPGRAQDVAGLPRAFIQVNGRDPLRDEGIEYAGRLLAAGVPVELYAAADLVHGVPPRDHPQVRNTRLLLDAAIAGVVG